MSQGPKIDLTSYLIQLDWSSIVRGGFLGAVLSFLTMMPLLLYKVRVELVSGDSKRLASVLDQAATAPEVLLGIILFTFPPVAFSCYWASRRAENLYLSTGVLTAVASFIFISLPLQMIPGVAASGASGAAGSPNSPLIDWYGVLSWVSLILAGFLGGWIASRRSAA